MRNSSTQTQLVMLSVGLAFVALMGGYYWPLHETASPKKGVAPTIAHIVQPPPVTPLSPYKESAPAAESQALVTNVNSVAIYPAAGPSKGVVIQAAGIVASGGWTDPSLVPADSEKDGPGVRTFRFVATPPDKTDSSAAKAIYVQLRVESLPSEVKALRIVSASNTETVLISRPSNSNPTRSAAFTE